MVSEIPTMHIGENSPEEVALKLLRYIASVERKVLHTTTPGSGEMPADRNGSSIPTRSASGRFAIPAAGDRIEGRADTSAAARQNPFQADAEWTGPKYSHITPLGRKGAAQ